MELLRNLFGSLASGVIRLAVAAGILACAYLFIVKPVLNSADDAIRNTNDTIQKSLRTSGFDHVAKQIEGVSGGVQRQVARSLRQSKHHGNSKRLVRCIERAQQNVHRLQHCADRYG
jgi:hypothetical protein